MEKRWILKKPDPGRVMDLARSMDCHRAVAAALVNRGLDTKEAIREFFSPSLARINDPLRFADMEKAAERVLKALVQKEKILVFGDFDADGITSTALLAGFIREMGGECETFIPHRKDGYGLQERHAELLSGYPLTITVDCGVSSREAVQKAAELGADVVVTDHHTPEGPLPRAVAVVNPKREDCPSGRDYLAGVGVAFSLCAAVRILARKAGFFSKNREPNLKKYLDLVAVGTLADVVPLVGDNRILTHHGMSVLRSAKRPGFAALMDSCNLKPPQVEEENVAYALAPRLNAAGRMGHAGPALACLMAGDMAAAARQAEILETENRNRQEMEARILAEALELARGKPGGPAMVFCDSGWHEGVIGIVAARLTRKFHCPAAVLALENGTARGSARSVEGVNLFDCLTDCKDLLEAFGGHAMAAGLTVKAENIEEFSRRFTRSVTDRAASNAFVPQIPVDLSLSLTEIGPALADELRQLAPYGRGNEEPVFVSDNVHVRHVRPAGEHGFRLILGQDRGPGRSAVWFSADKDLSPGNLLAGVCYRVRWNRFRDRKTLELRTLAVK